MVPSEQRIALAGIDARGISRTGKGRPYRVGEPLQEGRTRWPKGAHYAYGVDGHELTLFWPGVTAEVERAVAREDAEFALVCEPPLLIFAYRFGAAVPWADVPYAWHLTVGEPRVIPPPETSPEERALLWVSLVDARNGLICAQRGVALAPGFTRALHAAIREQARAPFNAYDYLRSIASAYLQYPEPTELLARAEARTFGNE
jgi:hypothetical protein